MGIHKALLKNKIFRRTFLVRIYNIDSKYYKICRLLYKPMETFQIECSDDWGGNGSLAWFFYNYFCKIYRKEFFYHFKMLQWVRPCGSHSEEDKYSDYRG